MTLGSNKTLFFNRFNKNESKKQKSDEEMNGFMREDNNHSNSFADDLNNERYASISYETPSKRSRIDPTMASDSNRRNSKSILKDPFEFMRSAWDNFKGRTDRNAVNANPDNSPTVANSNRVSEVVPSPPGTNSMETNVISNENVIPDKSRSIISKLFTRKRGYESYSKQTEKQRYQELLKRHTSHNLIEDNWSRRVKMPEITQIDLTSDTSLVSTNNSIQKSEQLFKSEILDKSSAKSLLNRIKGQPLMPSAVVAPNRSGFTLFNCNSQRNWFSFKHSTPKFHSVDQKLIQTLQKTPESSERTVSISSLPESSKNFNNLIENKKNILDSDFVIDLRNSLFKSNELDDRNISKCESRLNECQKKRESDCLSLSAKMRAPVTRNEIFPYTPFIGFDDKHEDIDEEEEEEEEESVPSDFPVLTPDMNKEIDAALKPCPPNEVLSEGFTMQICRKDMETLKGLNWLNDEIINFYLALIVERGRNDNFSSVHAFNTFFYKKLKDNGPQSLKRWTRKIDVFANDFVFIPIHLGMHWCLAVIDFLNKRIDYYDSMGGTNTECVQALRAWLQAESLDKKKSEFPMTDWTLQMVKDIPQQMNGSDCGMFSCKYAEYVSRKAKINFSQAHMPYFRRRMIYEILTKQLL